MEMLHLLHRGLPAASSIAVVAAKYLINQKLES